MKTTDNFQNNANRLTFPKFFQTFSQNFCGLRGLMENNHSSEIWKQFIKTSVNYLVLKEYFILDFSVDRVHQMFRGPI